MAEDVPKTIILSLLILTVLISVLGTWTVIDRLNDVKVQYRGTEKLSDQGNVKLGIINPDDYKPIEPPSAMATGHVVLGIMEPPKEEVN